MDCASAWCPVTVEFSAHSRTACVNQQHVGVMYFAHEIEFRTQALHECKLLLGVFPHAFPQATNPYSLRQLRASTLIKLRKNRSISLAHSRFIHGLSLARSISLPVKSFDLLKRTKIQLVDLVVDLQLQRGVSASETWFRHRILAITLIAAMGKV
jgi:hypothetical protein